MVMSLQAFGASTRHKIEGTGADASQTIPSAVTTRGYQLAKGYTTSGSRVMSKAKESDLKSEQ